VGDNFDVVLGGHEHDRHDFTGTSRHSSSVNLAEVNSFLHNELLENDFVLRDLSSSYTAVHSLCFQRVVNVSVSADIISVSRLLNPERVVLRKCLHTGNGGLDIPLLVGVHHQSSGSNLLFDPSGSFHIIFNLLRSNLHLKVLESLFDELLAESTSLFLRVAEPSSTSGVGRVTIFLEFSNAFLPVRTDLLENRKAFFRSDAVSHVSEVDHLDELLRLHVADKFPEGLLFFGGPTYPRKRSSGR